jgi:internalin A
MELDDNELAEIPSEIGKLTGLPVLVLNKNRLVALPPEIGELFNLRTLELMHNRLIELPSEIGKLTSLEDLDIRNNELTLLPRQIGQLASLEELNLSFNRLRAIPAEIGHLSLLMSLILAENELAAVPAELGLLSSLKILNLSKNLLASLPSEISRLSKLDRLVLSNNVLTSLPSWVGQLDHLTLLDVSGNRLTGVPAEIGELINLKELDLSFNQLTDLPPELGLLTNLQTLDLSGNRLTKLPKEIGKLINLRELRLYGNRMILPPVSMFDQGTAAILAYLQELLDSESKQWTSKLLLVGEGGVGKTSLLRALLEEPFDHAQSSTDGIEIRSLCLKHPNNRDLTMELNAWDFGGQEIYHATHQFFLTNRSLFLLLWNARYGFEQGKLYYWLDTVQALAPESPIILVATSIDEREPVVPFSDLRRRYPQIVSYCKVSNKTGVGVDALRREIAKAASNLPLMGETWPTSFFNAANAIRRRSKERDHITPVQLQELMIDHGVKYHSVLSQHLHDLGDILYFLHDDQLNDTVILNPEWVDQSISKVLQSEEVINNRGLLTSANMNTLWSDIDASLQAHLLRLMERFDLSYRTLENKEVSLVVERLSLDPPPYTRAWNEVAESDSCREISLKIHFATTIPAGVPTWFIARSHRFTTHTHWRYGALLADDSERKHLALVNVFPHERYLQLTVRGPFPYNFFALLRDGLDLTLKRFPGLESKIELRVPCVEHGPCPHEFDVKHLEGAIQKQSPISHIQCPVAFRDVSVAALLFGIHWSIQNDVLRNHYESVHTDLISKDQARRSFGALMHREFLKMFRREQTILDAACPNVFALRPYESERWGKQSDRQRIYLQLYCQAPGEWHATESDGRYLVTKAADWLEAMAYYIRSMATVFGYSMHFDAPRMDRVTDYERTLKRDMQLMQELVGSLPEASFKKARMFEEAERSLASDTLTAGRLARSVLRNLRRTLDEKDPEQHWGGLKRVITPEGHLLWLCPHHTKELTPAE